MTQRPLIKVLGTTLTFAGTALAMMLTRSPAAHANDDWDDEGSRIKIGFAIAPVPLNLNGKDRNLVGLGS
jgi:hypothetical protein